MKKLFFIAIMILLPFLSGAQNRGNDFQLGFTASPNIGMLRIDDDRIPSYSADGGQAGFSYGVLADFGFARNYYFSTAFLVSTINGKSEMTASNSGPGSDHAQYTYKLQYLEIPLTLKLKSNENTSGRFYGQFGLGTGINIRARRDGKLRNGSGGLSEVNNENISSDVNTFRLALIVGAGAEWKIPGNLNILTGVTYNNGFTKVLDKAPEARSSYLALTLGVFF